MSKFYWWQRIPRKWQRAILMLACLFSLHTAFSLWRGGYNGIYFGFSMVQDPFGSQQTHQCSIGYETKKIHSNSISRKSWTVNQDVCYPEDEDVIVDIHVSDVYDRLSVDYPKWVLTVIGWTDVIKVESWTSKPLLVIVLPHSHQDPGWLKTMESYFSSRTKPTLDYMIDQLTDNPSYSFIWSEVVMLRLWWMMATEVQRNSFKKLLDNGQLEIVSGGWVMTDESIAHYGAMIDQLTDGHIWLKNTLNVTVTNSWAIDPFGHSSTMAYLLKQSGIKNMVIQRTHYSLKRHLASQKQLEFFWRQPWDSKERTDIFCHMMPFLSYSIPHSCGPDRHVCCKYDFHSKNCFYGNKRVDIVEVDDNNINKLSTDLWQQLQKKSELFQADVILMPHGDDFRYDSWKEWNDQFGNLQKIMNYINSKPELQMQIKFGTLKDYFTSLSKSHKVRSSAFYPSVSGDFFLYSDRDDQYWSGYYTTRPYFKYLVRQLQQLLRSSEIMFSLTIAQLNWNPNMTALHEKLIECRRTLALSQHHDAITGTSKASVMESFTTRVQSALQDTTDVLKMSIQLFLSKTTGRQVKLNLTEEFFVSETIPVKTTLKGRNPKRLLVWNDLAQTRNDIAEVVIDMPSVTVSDKDLKPVPFQLSPVWENERKVAKQKYLLTFEMTIEPFSLATFVVQPSSSMPVTQVSKLYSVTGSQPELNAASGNNQFPVNGWISPHLSVSNAYMKAVFKQCNGMLHSVHSIDDNHVIQSDIHYATYSTGRKVHPFRDKSGAYIFLPDGVAKELHEQPQLYALVGNLFSEVRAVYKHFVHISRLYNLSGSLLNALQVENFVDINSEDWNNYELVMRIETDVVGNNQRFCTDSNGFQMHPRKTRAKMSIQGNVYPVTSAAIVENDHTRVSLLTAQSHGVASLVTGWLEVFLDRRLMQDDWRGLNEKVTDNALSKSSFYILFEKKSHIQETRSRKKARICLPSIHSTILMNKLNSPLKVFEETIPATSSFVPYRQNYSLARGFPCAIHVLNIKMLGMKEALITFHRSGVDCHFTTTHPECKSKTVPVWSDLSFQLKSVIETSLTGVIDLRAVSLQESPIIEQMTLKAYKLNFV